MNRSLLFVVNVDWFFLSHRLPIALEAMRQGYKVHIAVGLTNKLSDLQKHGLVVHPLNLERGNAGFLSTCRSAIQLFKLFRTIRPDIVHLVTIKPVLLGGIAARCARVPAVVAAVSGLGYVFTARGLKATVRRNMVGVLYRLALGHRNQKVIFQNIDDLQSVSKIAHLSKNDIVLIRGSGVVLDDFPPQALPNGVPIVLLAARLLVDKGVVEFVDAARELKKRNLVARFVLVGTIDLANPASCTQSDIDHWQKEGIVEVWGHRADMSQVIASAHVIVLPSYREGLPKILIEAAASARAVITTDVPGCRDAILNGVTGVLVPVRNSALLLEAIWTMLNDQVRCETMGKAGRKFAEDVFDVRQVVNKHLEVYHELTTNS